MAVKICKVSLSREQQNEAVIFLCLLVSLFMYKHNVTLLTYAIQLLERDFDQVKLWSSEVLMKIVLLNPNHATGLFLYPLKTSENLSLPDVSRGSKKKPSAWNGLHWLRVIRDYKMKEPMFLTCKCQSYHKCALYLYCIN